MGAPLKKNRGSSKQPEPDINVTPLVDVVLVLLIIFMVVTPALNEGEHIELPEIVNVDEKKEQNLIDLTMAANGRVLLEKEPVAKDALEARLAALYAADPERKVMLNADETLPYETMRSTFKLVQEVGFRGVKLKVLQQKKPGA
jgi:biopolymer transport protein TolR